MTREPEDLSRYLDGELELEALPEALRQEAAAFDRLVAPLRNEPMAPSPEVRERVMARVRALASSPWHRTLEWVTTPKTVRLSPLTASLALAAALAIIVVTRPPGPEVPTASTASARPLTRFILVAPDARSVAVTGDFVSWDPAGVPLEDRQGKGVWVVEMELSPGLHHYVFIVNGTQWRPDPNASQVDDGFGQQNSVLLVPPRTSS